MINKITKYKLLTLSLTLLITSAANYSYGRPVTSLTSMESLRTSVDQFDTGMDFNELMDRQNRGIEQMPFSQFVPDVTSVSLEPKPILRSESAVREGLLHLVHRTRLDHLSGILKSRNLLSAMDVAKRQKGFMGGIIGSFGPSGNERLKNVYLEAVPRGYQIALPTPPSCQYVHLVFSLSLLDSDQLKHFSIGWPIYYNPDYSYPRDQVARFARVIVNTANKSNEVVFKSPVPLDDITAIEVFDGCRKEVLTRLEKEGITHLGQVSLEELLVEIRP